MRISFDLDGVLADMDQALAEIAKREFGVSLSGAGTSVHESGLIGRPSGSPDPGVANGDVDPGALPASAVLSRLTARQQTRLWSLVTKTPNFWESLAEIEPGTIRRLNRIAQELGWEVLFVTKRPSTEGRTAQLQTQRWLARQGFELPSVYTTRGSRGYIASALTLDAHVDDTLDNAVDITTDSRAWSILVWRDDASFANIQVNAKRLNIALVPTVGQALDRLEQADRGARSGPSARGELHEHPAGAEPVLGRLKRAFGFRT